MKAPKKPSARRPSTPKARSRRNDMRAASYDARSFTSAAQSPARTDLQLARPRDYRQDLTASNRLEILARMRYGERNFGLTRQILADNVTYTVGSGLFPTSHASTSEAAQAFVRYFMDWARVCDVTRRLSFWDVQRLVQRRKWGDGDVFVGIVKDPVVGIRLQLIEAHRVGSPWQSGKPKRRLSDDGVNYDESGRVISYSVILDDGKTVDIDAQDIIHVFSPEWSTGSRGLPRLAHSWNDIQDYMEVVALEKAATKLHSEYSVVYNTDDGALPGPSSGELTDAGTDPITQIQGGKIIAAQPGKSVDLKMSQRPNSNFVAYLEAMQRDIAMASLPYEFVADASKLGSVGIRLVGSKSARIFEAEQNELNVKLNDKVWALVIADGIRRGALPADDAFLDVSWTGPKDVTVDAGRDAKNDRENIAAGLASFTEVYRVNGSDFVKEATQLARDYRMLYDLELKHGLPEGILTEGLRKGSTNVAAAQPSADTNLSQA